MSDNITQSSYYAECVEIATDAIKEAEGDKDRASELIAEIVDGHQWIIYYRYNDDVIRYSANEDAWKDCYSPEAIGQLVMNRGIDEAITVQACFAMMQDCQDKLDEAVEAYEESQQVESEG